MTTYTVNPLAACADAKENRKARELQIMKLDRESEVRSWTVEQAKARVAYDIATHADFVALGNRGTFDSFYLRSDMAMQAGVNDGYDAALKEAAPELYIRVKNNESENASVDLSSYHAAAVG